MSSPEGTLAGSDRPLWQPSRARIERANLTAFIAAVERAHAIRLPDYAALWRWSVENQAAFWREIWSFCGVIAETQGDLALVDGDKMPGAAFFPAARVPSSSSCHGFASRHAADGAALGGLNGSETVNASNGSVTGNSHFTRAGLGASPS